MNSQTPIKKRIPDTPWVMRTYSGHSSAAASNALFRKNLDKGQTGLSVAFDLPTQTGFDSDHVLAKGEVGKVGVPINHLEDMEVLFKDIPLEKMNTSMTINATAPWLLALYIALAQKRGIPLHCLSGTTQNDLLKEYLSRGTYIFPPDASMRLITDMITYTVQEIPKWNPINICSYHLQEAGATPVQELAIALCNAIEVLDRVKNSGKVSSELFPKVVGRISFFVNAGIRFVEELCKMRTFTEMWNDLTLRRYGVKEEKYRRFRYGVQVNSLGLTERQPENNNARILLEMLSVTLSKGARARAVQLPAWNEALGLPRPWDQQLSLRMQQILAFETDLLEYEDLFEGSLVIDKKVKELVSEAQELIDQVLDMGGAVKAIESGYLKGLLVESNARRFQAIEEGSLKVVGVNCFQTTEDSPLTLGEDEGILKVDSRAEELQIERLNHFRKKRSEDECQKALKKLREVALSGGNIMSASIDCAHKGVTTGQWADCLREVFGQYRAPTGVSGISAVTKRDGILKVQEKVKKLNVKLKQRLRILIGKPGLDGHSNGAEQIAVRARDVGMEVVYQGIRLTPEELIQAALEEDVHVIGLSILSGSHLTLVSEILKLRKEKGLEHIPIVLGGIIPQSDQKILLEQGVARIYTPKAFDLNSILSQIVDLVESLLV